MKNQKAIIFVSSILALSVIYLVGFNGQPNPFSNVAAGEDATRIYRSGNFGLDGASPKSGIRDIGDISYFYYSEAAQSSSDLIVLQAKDAVTPGTLMNLTVINGLKNIKVTFSGTDSLFINATKTIFEDYSMNPLNALTSGVSFALPSDTGYLMILTDSTAGISISDFEICFSCSHEVDAFFASAGNNTVGYARSVPKSYTINHSFILEETNPTATSNNYAHGTDINHPHDYSWYRWNGIHLQNASGTIAEPNYDGSPFGNFTSSHFEVQVTAFIDPAVFYDSSKFFCLAPWIHLRGVDHAIINDGDQSYMQSYIGSDNYDPIGGINTDHGSTYRNRFFTNYAWDTGAGTWQFQNPDTTTVIGDPATSLREAYERINLPFWNVRFVVNGNDYSVYINGLKTYEEIGAFYETYTDQQYTIHQFCLQAVNYGDGVGGLLPSYQFAYSMPQIRQIVI